MSATHETGIASIDQISIARQPIVDAERNVVGHELFNRTPIATGHTVASDISLALNAIANSNSPFAVSHTDLFVHALHEGLNGGHWDFLDPQHVVAVIPPVDDHAPQRIAQVALSLDRLRQRGFKLCFQHMVVAPVYKAWQPFADYVKIDLAAIASGQIAPLVAAIRARTSALPIATKVESAEQFAQLQALNLSRFQGYWFSEPELLTPRVLTPSATGAIALFNLLSRSAPVDEVENALKKDAALGVNLLRIVNSASAGLRDKVMSLRQAVMLIGYEKLAKWSALVLATASPDSSGLIQSSAIVRGRMMELLALQAPEQLDAGSAFLVGLLSQIEGLLGCPMQSTLAQLSLNDDIVGALLGQPGVYRDLLRLVVACESENDPDFPAAFARLHFSLRQINLALMDALAWTDGALA